MSYKIKTFDQFINEAEDTGIQKTGQSITIPVGGVFNSGTFEIGNKQIIDDKMPEIIAFLNQYPKNQRMEVNVEAMESQVPNRGVNMKPGELAEKRTQSMVNFLSQKLKDFKNNMLSKSLYYKLNDKKDLFNGKLDIVNITYFHNCYIIIVFKY